MKGEGLIKLAMFELPLSSRPVNPLPSSLPLHVRPGDHADHADHGDGKVEGGGEACIDCEHCGNKLLETCSRS